MKTILVFLAHPFSGVVSTSVSAFSVDGLTGTVKFSDDKDNEQTMRLEDFQWFHLSHTDWVEDGRIKESNN